MSASTTSTVANTLIRRYSREKWFAPFEREMTQFLDELEDCENEDPTGSGRYFRLWLADAHATGSVAESGSLPNLNQPTVLQGSVTGIQVTAAFGVSELLLSAGVADGTLGADTIADHVEMTTRNLMTNLNRLSLGHGTARMAVVNADTSSSTQFVCRLPEHCVQLRVGMAIDFYDTDSGGSKQGNTVRITAIDFGTRTVTISAAASLTAGWGVYQSLNAVGSGTTSTYGVAPNGMRGVVDNGTYASSIFGHSRATYPKLNAQVIGTSTGYQAYSEKLMRKGINRVFFESGAEVEEIWTNQGIISEHLNHTVPDRVYMVTGEGKVPKYKIGADIKAISFQWNGKEIPFRVDGDLPAREAFGITKSLWRRHYLRKASWIGDDSGADGASGPVLMQLPGSANYALAKIAGMLAIFNLSHRSPCTQVRWEKVADEELAGDRVPVP